MATESAAWCRVGTDGNDAAQQRGAAASFDDGPNEAGADENASEVVEHQKRGREVTRFTHLRKAED